MPPPELGRIQFDPKEKTLTEVVKEKFARYDAEIQAIAGDIQRQTLKWLWS
jgi:hypothetical protein